VSSIAVSERPRVSLRPLALPAEHGGWGFLLEPIVLGLIVAPSSGGVLIATGAVAAFLARHPLKLAAQDWLRHKRYPRTRACALLALGYGALAVACFAAAPWHAVAALAAALPFALAQFVYDARNRGRAFTPELFGVIAPGAIAGAIAIAAGRPVAFAATLWLLMALRAVPSILYVRSALRGSSRAAMISAHVVAIAIAAFISPVAGVAMVLLLVRAIPSTSGVAARMIGMRELAWGALTVGLLAFGFLA
jgi:YwiC-like protein